MNTRQILLTVQLKIKRLGDQAAELGGGIRAGKPFFLIGSDQCPLTIDSRSKGSSFELFPPRCA